MANNASRRPEHTAGRFTNMQLYNQNIHGNNGKPETRTAVGDHSVCLGGQRDTNKTENVLPSH
jgi:hypothetical protein